MQLLPTYYWLAKQSHACTVINDIIHFSVTSDSTTVTRFPNTSTVYTSDGLSLTCVTTVSEAVDIPVQVTHQWVGPGGVVSTNSLVSVSSVTSSGQDYSSTVLFSSLRSSHSGTYTCSSTVSAEDVSVFIATSAIQTASTSFDAGRINMLVRLSIILLYCGHQSDYRDHLLLSWYLSCLLPSKLSCCVRSHPAVCGLRVFWLHLLPLDINMQQLLCLQFILTDYQ